MNRGDHVHWQDCVDNINSAKNSLRNPDIIWYRGVSSSRYRLIPSLLRYQNGTAQEQALFERYRQALSKMKKGGRPKQISQWQQLFAMQHFDIPTRLLDWSEALTIAIFFAVFENLHGEAAIYILDPIGLNKRHGRERLFEDKNDEWFSYKELFWDHVPFTPVLPIAINPRQENHNLRLLAQQGRFTIHGVDNRPLDALAPECVRRVVIPERAKPGANEFLRMAGVNETTAFPDFQGAALYVRHAVPLIPFLNAVQRPI